MSEGNLVTVNGATTRRGLLSGTGKVMLSGAAIAMLAGCRSMAAESMASEGDLNILNVALGAEYQAIAAYQVGAESGLLQRPVLQVAVKFQSDHKQHAELLASTLHKLGGTPVTPKPPADYGFPTGNLHNQADVLRFAAGLEKGAVAAYLGAVPAFQNRDLAKAAASILGDEAIHFAVLRQAIGEDPDPSPFVG
ncbi:MAG TPA: ferritin-like domain-containing protein [Stellaceae bacterium]|jgi:rubrerythrin|nr:ferritin-like domain-containing protein [Stellaceae bacterium]